MDNQPNNDTPAEVRAYMKTIGHNGGLTKGKTKARDPEKMRDAINKRWKKYRAEKEAIRKAAGL